MARPYVVGGERRSDSETLAVAGAYTGYAMEEMTETRILVLSDLDL